MTSPDPAPPVAPAAATPPPPATLAQVAGAVFWSFFGVRKGRHMQQDTATIKMHHVVIVGVLTAFALVLALVGLVMFITRGT
jgi:DUF2970 family protein